MMVSLAFEHPAPSRHNARFAMLKVFRSFFIWGDHHGRYVGE